MTINQKLTPAEVVLTALRSMGMVVPPNIVAFEIASDGTNPNLLRVRFDCFFTKRGHPVLASTNRAHYEIRITGVDSGEL